ncbi:MAG: NusG domain II-containing protein [Christensenellales bacterium]
MKHRIRKDLLFIAGLIVVICSAMFAISFFAPQLGSHAEVCIKVNGQETGRYPLNENREIPLQTEYGYNLVVIENGSVFVREADCNNHDCISQGSMNLDNYTQRFLGNLIVCLPHKLEIELVQNP